MSNEEQEVATLVRSGAYFKEALAWYQTRYIAPIAERAFFLIIAATASLIGLVALIAVMRLMPLSSHPAILIPSPDIYQQVPKIIGLRERTEPLNVAMRKFFLIVYLSERESYKASEFATAAAFVGAHSDPAVGKEYLAAIARQNPQSALHQVGDAGERKVEVRSLSINEKVDPPLATMTYFSYDIVGEQSTRTLWQATVAFNYTPLIVKEVVDKDSGETIIQTEEPQFQVVKYERQQFKASSN